jgi:DNA-binding response OmpR family regulator
MPVNPDVPSVRSQKPCALVLDLMLPIQDGMSICRAIRKFSAVPILMLTARGDEADVLAWTAAPMILSPSHSARGK